MVEEIQSSPHLLAPLKKISKNSHFPYSCPVLNKYLTFKVNAKKFYKKKKKELYGIFAFDHVINIRLHTSLTMFKSKAF